MTNPFAEVPARTLSPVANPVADPEPLDVEETPVEAQPEADPAWPHATLEFCGDVLEVRKPTEQALAAYSLASSKYVSMEVRNDMTGLFIARHMSPESYSRVFSRLLDPDDEEYTIQSIGELMRAIVELRATQSK